MQHPDRYIIERRGGFAGLKASGTIDGDAMDPGDRQLLEQLLDSEEPFAKDPGADRYTYLVTRENALGSTTREIPESVMPSAVASVVKAEI
jgi:Emfourin